jgi:hypothetical protein
MQVRVSSAEQSAVFDSAAVQGLEQLQRLSLGRFADFKLQHLPPSLRRLRQRFDRHSRVLSVPELPEHARWGWRA